MNKLTLLCPTYNRHQFLARSINYWQSKQVDVIFVDGSLKSFDVTAAERFKNIRYYHNQSSVHERLLFALPLINTPYAAFIGDDEFFLPKSIDSCLNFLSSHPDYVACIGRALGFQADINGIKLLRKYPKFANRDLSSESPYHRLYTHFSNYCPSHSYAIIRTPSFIHAMEYALNLEYDIFAIGELVFEALVICQGKSRVIPHLHWLRSYEAPPIRSMGDRFLDPNKKFEIWWNNRDYYPQKIKFCSSLSSASIQAVNQDQIETIFDLYTKNLCINSKYAIIYFLQDLVKRSFSPIFKFLRMINKYITAILRPFFSPLCSRDEAALHELRNQNVIIDDDDLAECLYAINASWKTR